MRTPLVDRIEMQHRLFGELSRMFGQEVPLYDRSLLVNRVCNRVVCDLLAAVHTGFSISDEQLERTGGERHGAIRIGSPVEYRWIARFFDAFAMEPHNYYDMSNVGAKSQPIVATAFRSAFDPEHRVFCSLLMTDYFDPETKARIDALIAGRSVFTDRAKSLIETHERQGGLDRNDADALIREGVDRIFRWTGTARDHRLYQDLCRSGFRIAADIACFESHHLNHLTPNTLCIDLYTTAMKFCMGELDEAEFHRRGARAIERLLASTDRDMMRLFFRHLSPEEIDAFGAGTVARAEIERRTTDLAQRLRQEDLDLTGLRHAGFKDATEGPPYDTPIFLRQDAYRALTEPVRFREAGGGTVDATHTARFGEIEQRFYAATPAGRALYDRCLAEAETMRERELSLVHHTFASTEEAYVRAFAPIPKTLAELRRQRLVYARWTPTAAGLAAAPLDGAITEIDRLVELGYARVEGVRYEDFLPVSAAGIFASNLSQYGTKSTADTRPVYTRAMLEEILGRPIIDADAVYRAIEATSLRDTWSRLGVLDHVPAAERDAVERAIEAGGRLGATRTPAPVAAAS
ncbi:MAG: VOC family protein [Phycisphaeraceae bacterium]|nr:VOC family protein [Phycisphaeraceae bacterium]